ncbi:MAG: helix-turn-helix domain-containing protein, partial [Nitrososphaeraceae archaeon]
FLFHILHSRNGCCQPNHLRILECIQVEWRRRQVFELSSKGQSQTEIARTLQISESTISRDLDYLREQAKTNIKRYIDERLPEEYEKCLVGLNTITKEAWNTANQTEDRREKIQALSLAKECYSMKLELLTNATVVDDAIRFVSKYNNKNNNSSNNTGEKTIAAMGGDEADATAITNQVF